MADAASAIRGRVILASARKPISLHLWKFGAMPCSPYSQCGITCKRGNSAVAAQCFLDASGAGLHAVDDRPVRMDVLRSLSTPFAARHVLWRHCFFLARHSNDGGAGAAPASQTGRASLTVRLSGFCAVNRVVDVLIRL